jgi:hypothetical protein
MVSAFGFPLAVIEILLAWKQAKRHLTGRELPQGLSSTQRMEQQQQLVSMPGADHFKTAAGVLGGAQPAPAR